MSGGGGLVARDVCVAGRLREATLTLGAGEIVAVVGPNGAGKSSLLAALAGLLRPDSGAVTLDGGALAAMPGWARARAIGYLPQAGEVAWDMSVRGLVALGRLPWRMGPATAGLAADAAAVAGALAAMELAGLADRPVSRLSGGERARVLFGRVLAGAPRWIIADEPLAALDLAHAARLMAGFAKAAREGPDGNRVGVVLAVHDLAVAMNHATRVVVLDAGGICADGAPEVVLTPGLIAQVWGVEAQWWGEAGARALAVAAKATT